MAVAELVDESQEEARLLADTVQIEKKGRGYRTVKRLFDIVASGLALIVLSPVMLILSAAIFIDDPHGSPFFVQTRVGKDGKEFRFYKFRSMVVNAEALLEGLLDQNEMEGHAFKMRDDPRITRIGKFIRRTSLDELPQLWNVFKGDMSIVGPRPPLPREVAEYDSYHYLRLSVRPGLTCIWQTTPHRNDLSFDEWVAMDIQYIQQRGVWVDLKLIFKTFSVMVTGQGE